MFFCSVGELHAHRRTFSARKRNRKPVDILKVEKTKIVSGGRPVRLQGVNLGGWLMPEGYIVHAPNRGYRFFKARFIKEHGQRAFEEIETAFRDNWIREEDFRRIASLGFNHVRLPFHYGLIETKPFRYSMKGLGYLDCAVRMAKRHGLRVILDMHAVPGSQNHDWHSDSDGRALFWVTPSYQRRAAALWGFLADRFRDEPAVAGYDLLNETVLDDARKLNRYYRMAIRAIRAVDRNHIIFLEGNRWAQDIACLDDFSDGNLALGIHFYEPLEHTFSFVPHLKYPLVSGSGRWDGTFMKKRLASIKAVAQGRNRPLWCGEFGVNARAGICGEDRWLKDVLSHFSALDVHWSYWTWKAVKNSMFPDGIWSYYPNDAWVNRPGPLSGWDTWAREWPRQKRAMTESWRTAAFKENRTIAEVIYDAT